MNTDWKTEVDKCSKCGKCHTVCPVFLETGDESMVSRGTHQPCRGPSG